MLIISVYIDTPVINNINISRPHAFVNLPLESSFLDKAIICAMINNLKSKEKGKQHILECDYSRITSVLLPFYFPYTDNWCISPEWVANENHRPDYTVFEVCLVPGNSYGECTPHLIAEIKNKAAISWWALMRNQVWDQADMLKQENGRLLVMAQIGFEVCLFKFDILKYHSHSGDYENFMPLLPDGWGKEDLDELDIKYITETTNNVEEIRVVKWRLDDPYQASFIHDLFELVRTTRP